MSTPTIDAAREWLATADTNADHAYRWWAGHPDGVAILPLGRTFEAIEVPPALADLVTTHPNIDGPVIRYGAAGDAYVLVPVGTSATWDDSAVLCLGDTHYLAVPDPSRCSPPGAHWMRPPDGSGHLTDPARVAAVLAEAVAR